jgi:recombination protein U
MQEFEQEIDHSIEYYRKQGILTGDRIRDKTFHSFGKGFAFAAKRDESLFDFWLFNKRFFGIEAKQTAEKSLPYKNVKDHQIKNLKLVNKLGGVGIFLINFRSVKRRGKDIWNATYALNVDDYIFYKENNDRSSIPQEYVAEKGIKLDTLIVGYSKPKKDTIKPKPKMGWSLTFLSEWNI